MRSINKYDPIALGAITMQNVSAVNNKRANAPLYTFGEEIFNSVSHIVGGAFGIAVLVALLYLSYPVQRYMWACAVFGASVICLYTMSALYHFLPTGRAKRVFRIFDHCTIFLLIAGTYTPYCTIALDGSVFGIAILVAEWTLAVLGITGNAIAMNNKIIKGFSMAAYCVMGWMIMIAVKPLMQTISVSAFILLLSGGLAYTVGIVFFAFGKKVKYFHAVWHLFDIAGTALQFAGLIVILM